MQKEKLQQTIKKHKIRDYYEQLHANKMDNQKEMDRFLEKFNLPRVNQKEIDVMNNSITSTEIETVIKNLPTNKSPGPDSFSGKFLSNIQRRVKTYPSETVSKNCRGRKTSSF